ncbi:MAG: PVC-type heme-binding CxxCH protein [Mariniblastus sp.]
MALSVLTSALTRLSQILTCLVLVLLCSPANASRLTVTQEVKNQNPENQDSSDSIPNTQALSIPMTPPMEALGMMELPKGFQATLFAAEPNVHQPISVTTDARGRLWIAECYTYSDNKENYNTELNDRIVIFEDVDNDGVFDKRKVFWDKGKKLTSVEVGFGGVWVTAAPNLMFIPDRNGDDLPDGPPEILLDGFEGDVIRHNIVNGLRWGPDGWLYGRHGIQATSFVGPPGSTESQRVAMNCSIWRIHPVTQTFEIVAEGGTNPWGFDYDEHGEMFMINTVIGHLFHVIPNARYRRMYGSHFNPHTYQVIEQTADHFHWDVNEEHWAVTKKDGMSDGTDKAGGGHAHTGLMIYQGNNWPKEFHNKLFTANFHGRRINSDTIDREGNSYVSHHGVDYFKTSDPWFRGVEMIYGPDGGVFLLDWSDIGECHENDGIHRTSGRIFKIKYEDATAKNSKAAKVGNLQQMGNKPLINLLSHPNQWYARKARRLLQERMVSFMAKKSSRLSAFERTTMEKIESEFLDSIFGFFDSNEDPKIKLRAMWAIYSCELATNEWLLKQSYHPDEHIRTWAVRFLADGQLEIDDKVETRFKELAKSDPSGLVRLYVASALPRFSSAVAIEMATILTSHNADANDRVQPSLIWFGVEPFLKENVDSAINLAIESKIQLVRRNIVRRLTYEIENDGTAAEKIAQQIASSDDEQLRADFLMGMSEALQGWNQAPAPNSWKKVSEKLSNSKNEKIAELVQTLSVVFGDGRATGELQRIAKDSGAPVESRRKAILAWANSKMPNDEAAKSLFDSLKGFIRDKSLTNATVEAFSNCPQREVAQVILSQFKRMDPQGKTISVNTLVSRDVWAKKLLLAIENGKVPVESITASHARQIMNFENDALMKQLTKVWGEIRQTSQQRKEQIEKLRAELTVDVLKKSDHEKGRMLFEKHCASCHIMFGNGGRIGPDLTGSDRKNLNYLLENIVDPSASVAESYRSSIITLDDGRLITGTIISQNDRTIEVQTKDTIRTFDRRSVDEIRKTKNSLMPEGLIDSLSKEEKAALFGFLSK